MEESIAKMFGIRTNIIVPNISWGLNGMHECDLLIVRPSGYAIEVEIKRSKSDLKADFKKKHDHSDTRIQKFYYALPEELLATCIELIPARCGIITVSKLRSTVIAKMHRDIPAGKCRKLTDDEMFKVAKLGVMRVWNLKRKLAVVNDKLDELNFIKIL
jgi:hypothetical protein